MKKILLSLAIIAGISLTATAQNTNNADACCQKQECPLDKKQARSLKTDLNLSEQQVNELKKVRQEFRDKAKAIRENKSLSKDECRKQIQALQAQRKEATDKIYTADQKDLLKKNPRIGNRRPNRALTHEPRMGQRPRAHQQHFAKDLNLTDAQKEQMKTLNKDFRDKSQKLRKEHKENIAKILSPEQQKQLEKQHKNNPRKFKRGDRKAAPTCCLEKEIQG